MLCRLVTVRLALGQLSCGCGLIVSRPVTPHNLRLRRDLKPENFLLADKSEHAPMKATDFGLSVFYKPGQIFNDIVGSAYYVAPEVCCCHPPTSSMHL